jgi:hypothetical protein
MEDVSKRQHVMLQMNELNLATPTLLGRQHSSIEQ